MKPFFYLLFIWGFLLSSCGSDNPDLSEENKNPPKGEEVTPPVGSDTITYRAHVWVEKADLARYGGERVFKNKLKKMFQLTTLFWNESTNKFKYYFQFVPGEELYIYDINGDTKKYNDFKNKAFGPLNTDKYDFVLFLALGADNTGLSCGGGGASGQAVTMCYVTKNVDIFVADYPKQGTYSDLGHEYGHVRGAMDFYQYIIEAKDNPVNGEALRPPQCNMGNGMWAWSDYCSALFNYAAHDKQLPSGLSENTFPQKLKIKVTDGGQPKRGVTLKFFGTRAGGDKNNRDVYPTPYRTFKTGNDGCIEIENLSALFNPDANDPDIPPKDVFPYWRWFSFLVEATNGTTKKYIWVRDFDTKISFFEGKNIHEESISF